MLKKLLLLALFMMGKWAGTGMLMAQISEEIIIEGNVYDSDTKEPLPGALIVLSQPSKMILTHTLSDHNGHYYLSMVDSPQDSIQLEVDYLGYEKLVQPINLSKNKLKLDLGLKAQSLKIQTIEVQAERVIRQEGDTTVLQAAFFSDGTEFSVEDLLKKLPGVEVEEDGTLSYKNKTIESVFIENDDLFGQQYTVGTKNIAAEAIESFEFIDHFIENKQLQTVAQSNTMALNLKLKEAFKYSLSGTLRLGLGTAGRHAAQANGLLIGTNFKGLLLLGKENIARGLYSQRNENLFTELTGIDQANYWSIEAPDIINYSPVHIPNIDGRPAWKNNDRLASINLKKQLFPKVKLGLNGLFNKDLKSQAFTEQLEYLDVEEDFNTFTQTSFSLPSELVQFKLSLDWEINAKAFLRLISNWKSDRYTRIQTETFQNNLVADQIQQETLYENRPFNNAIAWTQQLDSSRSIQLIGTYSENRLSNSLFAQSSANRFGTSLEPASYSVARQTVLDTSIISGFQATYFWAGAKDNGRLFFGGSNEKGRLRTALKLADHSLLEIQPFPNNDFKFSNYKLWMGLIWALKGRKDELSMDLILQRNWGDLRIASGINSTFDFLLLKGRLNYRRQLSLYDQIVVVFGSKPEVPSRKYWLRNPVLISYNNLQTGIDYLFLERTQQFSFSYLRTGKNSFSTLGLLFALNLNVPTLATTVELEDWFSNISFFQGENFQLSTQIFGKQYVHWMRGNLNYKANIFRYNYQNRLNSEIDRTNYITLYQLELGYSSGFQTWINGAIKFRMDCSEYLSKNAIINERGNFTNLFFEGRVILKPFDHFHFKAAYTEMVNKNGGGKFFDFTCFFHINNRLSFELSGNHIFSGGEYQNIQLSDFSRTASSYRLMPEYLLLTSKLAF